MKEIDFQWEKGEEILDIASGSCHSLVLTNKYVYFFGSIEQGQNPFSCMFVINSFPREHMHSNYSPNIEPAKDIC